MKRHQGMEARGHEAADAVTRPRSGVVAPAYWVVADPQREHVGFVIKYVGCPPSYVPWERARLTGAYDTLAAACLAALKQGLHDLHLLDLPGQADVYAGPPVRRGATASVLRHGSAAGRLLVHDEGAVTAGVVRRAASVRPRVGPSPSYAVGSALDVEG